MKMYGKSDVDASILDGKKIAIIGYGSQGRAHASNLKDSGHHVVVGLRDGSASTAAAKTDGHTVQTPTKAASGAELVALLTPDTPQAAVYAEIESHLPQGAALLFAHGFNIHFGQITPRADLDVIMIAPKGPGDLVRRQYIAGQGVPSLVAIAEDRTTNALQRALAYADGIGGTRAGVIETTFKEETETDLFGEQAVLCGGATELVVRGFETLVEAGYQPEVAYYECMHELKLIVDLLHEGGRKIMHEFISDTALWGDHISGPRVVDAGAKARMKDVLTDIQSGKFAREWIAENEAGKPEFQRLSKEDLDHPIEEFGARLRKQRPWLNN